VTSPNATVSCGGEVGGEDGRTVGERAMDGRRTERRRRENPRDGTERTNAFDKRSRCVDGESTPRATPRRERETHQSALQDVDVALAHHAIDVHGVQEPPVQPRSALLERERDDIAPARGVRRVQRRARRCRRGLRHRDGG
jgi:hypothetical protein